MEVRPGYKHTEVGVIPEDWDVSTVGHEFSVQLGKMLDAKRNTGVSKPYLGNKAVQWGAIDIFDLPTVPMSRTDLARFRLEKGDLLVCEGGEVGRAAIWDAPLDECYYQKALHRLRPIRGFDPRLMVEILREWSWRGVFANYVTQTSIAHLPREKFIEVPIPRPSPSEQRAIAAALSDVDALLGGLDQLIAKKRDLNQAAMQQLLTGQTRLPGFSGAWKNTTLGQIISRFSTGLNPRQNFRLNNGGNFFYVTIKNFAVGQLLLDENCDLIDEAAFWRINERSDLRKDDVLFSSIGRVGDAYLITETPRNWNINESVFTLRPDKTQVVPLMLFYLLTDKIVTDALSQGVTGSTFKSIKQAQLKAIPCQLPALLEEQTAIATVLSDMDAELAALEARRDKTRDLKQAMMQELLTGRTRLV